MQDRIDYARRKDFLFEEEKRRSTNHKFIFDQTALKPYVGIKTLWFPPLGTMRSTPTRKLHSCDVNTVLLCWFSLQVNKRVFRWEWNSSACGFPQMKLLKRRKSKKQKTHFKSNGGTFENLLDNEGTWDFSELVFLIHHLLHYCHQEWHKTWNPLWGVQNRWKHFNPFFKATTGKSFWELPVLVHYQGSIFVYMYRLTFLWQLCHAHYSFRVLQEQNRASWSRSTVSALCQADQ